MTEMSNNKEFEDSEINAHNDIVKFIIDLSKEMNIEGAQGVIGNELELIALVRNCPFLYDKNRSDFKDINRKNVAWHTIASVMHSEVHEVQQRWRSLRDAYNKHKKDFGIKKEFELLPENNCTPKSWELYKHMKFLEPHIIHRRSIIHRISGETKNLKDEISENGSPENINVLRFIDCIQERPILYDNKHPSYKSREDKIQAWNEVANTLGVSAQDCENKWKILRERYGRERKLQGDLTARRLWPYFDALSFLDVHVKTRRHSITRPMLPNVVAEEVVTTSEMLNSEFTSTSSSSQSTILKHIIKDMLEPSDNADEGHEVVDTSNLVPLRCVKVIQSPNESKLSYLESNSDIEPHQTTYDEDELFGQTITAELRRIPSGRKKMKIKAEIYKIFYENESDD